VTVLVKTGADHPADRAGAIHHESHVV
jgi:hypothetical protein